MSSVIDSVALSREGRRFRITCDFEMRSMKRFQIDLSYGELHASFYLMPKKEFESFWELLAYKYSVIQSLSANKFLGIGFIDEQAWANPRLWEEVFKDITLTMNRTGTNLSIVFKPPETTERITFVYDENLQFVKRRPIGSMIRLPDRSWKENFFRPCIIERREQHYYFRPPLDDAINTLVKETPLQFQVELFRVWRGIKR